MKGVEDMYLCIPNKSYNVTNAYNKPYMKINGSILPLTSNGGGVINLNINNSTYRPMEYKSASNTYYTSAVNSEGLSSTTALTRASTYDTQYQTRASTSGTSYGTQEIQGSSYYSYISKTDRQYSTLQSWSNQQYTTMSFSKITGISFNHYYTDRIFLCPDLQSTTQLTSVFKFTSAQSFSFYSNNSGNYNTGSLSTINTQYLYNRSLLSLPSLSQSIHARVVNAYTAAFSQYLGIVHTSDTSMSFYSSYQDSAGNPRRNYMFGFTYVKTPGSTQTTGTTYLTRSSTYGTIYLTRSSTSGYSGISSSQSSGWE